MSGASSDSGLYETQYEALRAQMLGSTTIRGLGLAVLLQTGIAGWLRAVGTCANACAAETTRAPRPVSSHEDQATVSLERTPVTAMMSPTAYAEAARLIASLVLSGHQVPGPFRASP